MECKNSDVLLPECSRKAEYSRVSQDERPVVKNVAVGVPGWLCKLRVCLQLSHNPKVLGWSLTTSSLCNGKPASPSLCQTLRLLVSLYQINKYNLEEKECSYRLMIKEQVKHRLSQLFTWVDEMFVKGTMFFSV